MIPIVQSNNQTLDKREIFLQSLQQNTKALKSPEIMNKPNIQFNVNPNTESDNDIIKSLNKTDNNNQNEIKIDSDININLNDFDNFLK